MIVVTGATGQLGRLVIDHLLNRLPPSQIVAAVRNPEKAQALSAKGITVRTADYTQPASLDSAFSGADKILLISSNAVGERVGQHRAVIEAAARTGVKLIVYTSILHADSTPLLLGAEHRETEALLKQCGIPYALLRNGWYSENYAGTARGAVEHGAVIGSAGEGRISSAARADYAQAAAVVLASEGQEGKVYELAGDLSYSLAEFAAEIGRQSGRAVNYVNMPEADYKAALLGFGLPEDLAGVLADSEVGASKGGLYDGGKQLSSLIGRPTTPLAETIEAALKA